MEVLLPVEISKLLNFGKRQLGRIGLPSSSSGVWTWWDGEPALKATTGLFCKPATGAMAFQEGDMFHLGRLLLLFSHDSGPGAQNSGPVPVRFQIYANAPITQQFVIGAYIGVPLLYSDGSLFGTLCAIDPHPQSEDIQQHLPLGRTVGSTAEQVFCTLRIGHCRTNSLRRTPANRGHEGCPHGALQPTGLE